ncbi:hypothetical protein ACFRJ1_14300 [Streptomyces sp. NPDC056773]|uniref:hypothetical protein n=1 Tax=unclassified Streptomyces TaxID=2593676 RepID=UPI0036CBFFB8
MTDQARTLTVFLVDPASHHAEDQIPEGLRHCPEAGNPALDQVDLTALIDAELAE